jgi:hypothetical protein
VKLHNEHVPSTTADEELRSGLDEDDEDEQFLDDGKFSSGGRNTIAWLSTEDMMSLQ